MPHRHFFMSVNASARPGPGTYRSPGPYWGAANTLNGGHQSTVLSSQSKRSLSGCRWEVLLKYAYFAFKRARGCFLKPFRESYVFTGLIWKLAEVYSEVRELSRKLYFLTNKMASLEILFQLPALSLSLFFFFPHFLRYKEKMSTNPEPRVLVSVHCDFAIPLSPSGL